jgi:mannobiose 2-epimerase
MEYYIERLNLELRNIMSFWQKFVIVDNQIATQVSHDGLASFNAPLGSLFLSKMLYGSSATCRHLNEKTYKNIADLAFQTLTTKLLNPSGGFHWALDEKLHAIHDEANYSLAQAFAVYGMAEYYALTGDLEVMKILFHQIDFIETKIKDIDDGSYLDGFNPDGTSSKTQYKTLGTHLHLLEAYVKFMNVTKDNLYQKSIEHIIRILIDRFIDLKKGHVYHKLSLSWKPETAEMWIGHNVETAWILLKSASALKNAELISTCREILTSLCDHAIERGFDKQYGGIFNRFDNNRLITQDKEWWPQAESVIALMYAYHSSGNKMYLSYAIRLLEYIDNSFSDQSHGEWYDTISREGKPDLDIPKLHLWKSMYHNVRYCIEVSKNLEKIFVTI